MREIDNVFIPLPDGRRLAARIWLPDAADSSPVPAILEYLPYRKRDGTAPRDESTYPVFAANGYGGVRVDISGNGDSDGAFDDEYSLQEHTDGLEVIEWIARQSWCDGNVGMMGISWGGFNSLQLAALRPRSLKAVIAIGATVDRYNDDIHYKGGAQLYSNFGWSSVMLCFASRPPDPEIVGESWHETWMQRLRSQPFPLEKWLAHQRRDDYWRHGSVCEDFQAIEIPSLTISGWGDGYINAPPAMVAQNRSAIGINGPWIHKYPHFAWPRPRIDFHTVAIQWWDRWLKGIDNGADRLPEYRAYISENVEPGTRRLQESGRWVSLDTMSAEDKSQKALYLRADHRLAEDGCDAGEIVVSSAQDVGVHCGEYFPLKPDSEMSGDQASDDAGSVCFDTDVLDGCVDILGRPEIRFNVAINQTVGNLIVRLNDVRPDGRVHRVSWGVLNLCYRKDQSNPVLMTPNRVETVRIQLDECGYRFLPGHRIRLALSTAYWPMIVPPPFNVSAKVYADSDARLVLPVLENSEAYSFAEPTNPDPLPDYENVRPPEYKRWVEQDLETGLTHFRVYDDTGEDVIDGHGMHSRHTHEECWSVHPGDPLQYTARSTYISHLHRAGWVTKTVSESELECDAENFYLTARVRAFYQEECVHERTWNHTVKRDHM
ncbi:MAG: CocE/NonD family hydrolase [Pseudomonadota bacterium]